MLSFINILYLFPVNYNLYFLFVNEICDLGFYIQILDFTVLYIHWKREYVFTVSP